MRPFVKLSAILLFALGFVVPTGTIAQEAPPPVRIYVPAEELETLLQSDRPGVLMSTTQFDALLKASGAAVNTPDRSGLTAAQYVADLDDKQLRLTAELTALAVAGDWVTVPVRIGELGVESARSGEQPARVSRSDDGQSLQWLIDGTGPATLTLELVAPLPAAGGDRFVTLPLAGAPAGTLSLSVPAGKRLLVEGAEIERPAPLDQPAEYRIATGGRSQIELRITDRQATGGTDSLTFASTAHGLQLSSGEVTWSALTRLEVVGREIDSLSATVPGSLEMTAVESPGLEAWELEDDATTGRTRLTLRWRQPFSGSRRVQFRGLLGHVDSGEWRAPTVQLENATSHTGVLELKHDPELRVQPVTVEGARAVPAHSGQTAAASSDPDRILRYELWKEDFVLTFHTQPRSGELQVANTNLLNVSETGLTLSSTIDLIPRFAPLFELEVILPAEWPVTNLRLAGQPAHWQGVPVAAGVNQLRIPMQPPLAPGESRTVQLLAERQLKRWPIEQEPVRLQMPEVRIPQASLIEAAYGVAAPPQLRIDPVQLTGLDEIGRTELGGLARQVAQTGQELRLAFASQDTRYSAELELVRHPPQVSATLLNLTVLESATITSWIEGQLQSRGGGIRELQIRLPTSAGTDLQFTIASSNHPIDTVPVQLVDQQIATSDDAGTVWRLRFDRRVIGDLVFSTVIRQPRVDGELLTPPIPDLIGIDQQSGFLAVLAGSEERVTLDAVGPEEAPLPRIDLVDLPPSVAFPTLLASEPQKRIVAAVRTPARGADIRIRSQRFERAPLSSAIAQQQTLTTVIADNGDRQHELTMQLQAAGVQSLRLELPQQHTLAAAMIDDKPVEVHRTGEGLLIPFPLSAADRKTAHEVRVISVESVTSEEGRMQHVPPRIAAVTGSGADAPVEVLQSVWQVYLPAGTILTSTTGDFRSDDAVTRGGLLHWLSQWQLPDATDAKWMLGLLLAAAAVTLVVTLVLRRFGTLARVGILAILLLISAAGALAFLTIRPEAILGGRTDLSVEAIEEGSEVQVASESEHSPAPTELPVESATGNPDPFGDALAAREPLAAAEEARPNAASETTRVPPLPADQLAHDDRLPSPPPGPLAEGNSQEPTIQAVQSVPSATSALLSLPVRLEPPGDTVPRTFTYSGAAPLPELDITFTSREQALLRSAAIAAFLVLGLWWIRRWSWKLRSFVLLLLIAGPLVVAPLLPLAAAPVLDGIFLGGVLGTALWLARSIATAYPCCVRKPVHHPAKTAAFLLIVSIATVQPSWADGPQPTRKEGPFTQPHVFLPYDDPAQPLDASRVLIPRSLYLKLWRAANPKASPATPPPVAALVSEAHYGATLDLSEPSQPAVVVTATLALENLTTRSTTVILPISHVAVDTATLDGEPATVITGQNGELSVVLPRPGQATLEVTFRLAAPEATASVGRFSMSLKPTAAARLQFTLPQTSDIEFSTAGGTGTERIATADGAHTVTLPVSAGGDIRIAWRPRSMVPDAAEQLIHLDSSVIAEVTDAGLTVRHRYRLDVRQGTANSLPLLIPRGGRIRQLTGDDVAGWSIEPGDDRDRLEVALRRAVDDTTEINVELYVPLDVDTTPHTFEIPQVTPLAVTREAGTLVLAAQPHFLVQPGDVVGLRERNIAGIANEAIATPRNAYVITGRPVTLPVTLSRRQAEARVIARHAAEIRPGESRMASHFTFDLRSVPRNRLAITVPTDFVLNTVTGEMVEDWSIASAGDRRVLSIDLGSLREGEVSVAISGTLPAAGSGSRDVIFPVPQQADRLESEAALWIHDSLTANVPATGDWRSIDPASLHPSVRQLKPAQPDLAFRSTDPQASTLQVQLQPRQVQLSADAVVLAVLSETSVDHGFTLRWSISGGATDQLALATPGWLGSALEFSGDRIRRVEYKPLPDGRHGWRLHLDDPVSGQLLITAAVTSPLPEDRQLQGAWVSFLETTVPLEEARPLDVQQRFLVLVNLSDLDQLLPVEGRTHHRVPRSRLPLTLREDLVNQALEIVVLDPERPPAWRIERAGQSPVASASVLLATLRTFLSSDGTWRTQATCRVRNRGRQFIAIAPPEESRLLTVTVDGEPSVAVTTSVGSRSAWLVPLPATTASDLSFDIDMLLAGRLPGDVPLGRRWNGTIVELPAPHIIGPDESPEWGMPVQQTVWHLSVSDDLRVVPVESDGETNLIEGDITAARDADLQSVLFEARELLSLSGSALTSSSKYIRTLDRNAHRLKETTAGSGDLAQQQLEYYEKTLSRIEDLKQNVPTEREGQQGDGRDFVDRNTFQIAGDNRRPAVNEQAASSSALQFATPQTDTKKSQSRISSAEEMPQRKAVRSRLESQKLLLADEPASRQEMAQQAMPPAHPPGNQPPGMPESHTFASEAIPVEPQHGGLSLAVDLTDTQPTRTFLKVGGDPRLTLSLRPKRSMDLLLGSVWALVIAIAAMWMWHTLSRTHPRRSGLLRSTMTPVFLVSMLAAWLIAPPVQWVAIAIALIALVTLVATRVLATR